MQEISKIQKEVISLADRCVMCGLCSTHCPTYQLHKNENESPRGRIAIMKALAKGEIPEQDLTSKQHLLNCLQCRNCERLCPSGVSYGSMLDLSKSTLTLPKHNLKTKYLKPNSKRTGFLRMLQKSGTLKLVQITGLDQTIHRRRDLKLLPEIPRRKNWSYFYPAHIESQGQVALFTGCATDSLDNPTLDAGIRLLNRYGFSVFVPREQDCCGAMDLHNGNLEQAIKLASKNIRAFNNLKIRAILYSATGCGASLVEYDKLPLEEIETSQMTKFKGKPRELTQFLLEAQKSKPLPYKRLQKRVAVYIPCSARNVLKDTSSVQQMLSFIPGLNHITLPDQPACCGAAGTHMLTHPQQADALGAQVLQHIETGNAELVVTNNIGCKLHLQALMKEKGLDIPVIHPIALLNQQLA